MTRARDCLTSGDEQGAIAAALVAIAEVMVTEPPVEVAEITSVASIREREPNGYITDIREGVRRSARAARALANECVRSSDAEAILNRFGDSLQLSSYGDISAEIVIQKPERGPQ